MGRHSQGGGGGGGGNRWSRCLRAPLRVLCRARDLYVRSLTECAGRVQYEGAAIGFPTYGAVVPRSYSLRSDHESSGDEDLRELIRAASATQRRRRAEGGAAAAAGPGGLVARSQSVAVGRIDEDAPCEFGGRGGDFAVGSSLLFPRSRSYAGAGAKKSRIGAFS